MREYKNKKFAQKTDYYKDRFYHALPTPKSELPEAFGALASELAHNGVAVKQSFYELEIACFEVAHEQNLAALSAFKDAGFNTFTELIVADYLEQRGGYEVTYLLLNMSARLRARIRTFVPRDEALASGVAIFKALDWSEREAYDMLGINFVGHPRLKRLLMPDDWFDHPLKKSYPLQGDEHAQWYEIDKIFGKEYREVVGPEQRDPGRVDAADTNNFARIYHETPKGAEPVAVAYLQEYQEEGGVFGVKKVRRADSKFIEGRR